MSDDYDYDAGVSDGYAEASEKKDAEIAALRTEVGTQAGINVKLMLEVAALREAVLWLDKQRDPDRVFKPVGISGAALSAIFRVREEER